MKVSHPQCLQVIVHLQQSVDGVGDGGDDAVHNVNDPIGRVLVRFNEPGTVHCHHLRTKRLLE